MEKRFGSAPVFFTAISTILGAILFLRFGYATGTLGIAGVMLLILVGHMVTLPTALALSEIATNEKVQGGGEYFIISRSFGLNIGATIGITLFLSQAISVAFYIIAFTESFSPLFDFFRDKLSVTLPRQVISLPAMTVLGILILRRGANMGIKFLYIINAILFFSLIMFFLGKTDYSPPPSEGFLNGSIKGMDQFFIVFAIVFPAFTGMTAGVGLSGDLRNPKRSIPFGTVSATMLGLVIYMLVVWKLHVSASPEDLLSDQLVMSRIAVLGSIVVPIGLAASTLSSAIGSYLVAPRTLQALGSDGSFPMKLLNRFLARGQGKTQEPNNAGLVVFVIAFVFVAMGTVNAVAKIISMFFMVTYGSLCLISFLHHFGADPSYRPSFRSRWYLSLLGFLMCMYLMFKISTGYSLIAIAVMVLIYMWIHFTHKDRQGIEAIFQGAIFQLSRNLQVYLQKSKKMARTQKWRPAVVCVSADTFERDDAFRLVNWLSYKFGFGTYIHLIKNYFSAMSYQDSRQIMDRLVEKAGTEKCNVYLDTLISPSYTSAIAQVIQLPGMSGMENNMVLFEFDKDNPVNLRQIIDNHALVRAARFDVCVLGSSRKKINPRNGIHVWIRHTDMENTNLMILLSYIILLHPYWKKGQIKIFLVSRTGNADETKNAILTLVKTGRLPISAKNIECFSSDENHGFRDLINTHSAGAGLIVVGFRTEQLKHDREALFMGYDQTGNILFVNAYDPKEIT